MNGAAPGGTDDQAALLSAPLASAVLATAHDMIVAADANGRIVEWNPAAAALLGRTREEALGLRLQDVVAFPPSVTGADFADTQGRRIEAEALGVGGQRIPVELSVDEAMVAGLPIFILSMRDLTERRSAEAALRSSEARLAAFMANAPVGMYLKDEDGRYLLVNPEMAKVFGKPAAEVLGRSARDLFGDEAAGMIDAFDRMMLREGKPHSVEEHIPELDDYEWTRVVRFPVWIEGGAEPQIGGFDINITDLKRTEQRLRDSEGKLRTVVDNHPVPVAILRWSDLHIVLANPAFFTLINSDGDLAKVNGARWFETREENERVMSLLRSEERLNGLEAKMLRFGGGAFWASISWRHIDYDGEPALITSIYDLTELKRAQAELTSAREHLHQAEKLQALGLLLAGVAHELNNPLAAVVAQASLLEEKAAEADVRERAGRIRGAAERCARIVQTFLAIARQRESARALHDVNNSVREVADLVGHTLSTAGVELVLDLGDPLPRVMVDKDKVDQVLTNLLINAQHALAVTRGAKRVTVQTFGEKDEVLIRVADTGPGVPAEHRSRIFEPFFTTKAQGAGTGIGLSLSLSHALAQGGTLVLEETAHGASFALRLPVARAERWAPAPAPAPAPAALGSGAERILVVEGEADIRDAIAASLAGDGLSIDTAADGTEALRLALASDYSLILSDLEMLGLDGSGLYQALVEERPEMGARMVFLTGDTLTPAAGRFLASCGRPVLEKPFSPAALRRTVAETIAESRQ